MTITVITPGIVPKKLMKMKCSNCECLFTCEEGDTKVIPGDRPFDSDGRTCGCPTCGQSVWWTGVYVGDGRSV